MVQILPAILATNKEEYQSQLSKIISNPFLEGGWIQIDLIDNKFVQNQTITPEDIASSDSDFTKEVQLLVVDPVNWIPRISQIKNVARVTAPVELPDGKIQPFIKACQQENLEVGLSINPETNVEKVTPYLKSLDAVLIMGVNPGWQGQKFNPETLQKIKTVKQSGFKGKVGVDGGVNDTNIKDLVDAGVDYLAIGSYLLKGEDFDENLETLWEKIQ